MRIYRWEVAEIAKKTFMLGAVALIAPGSTMQLVVGINFTLVFMLLTGIVAPCAPFTPRPFTPLH